MQQQIKKVFAWVAEKHNTRDIMLRMYPDWSGDIVDERYSSDEDFLLVFDDIMDVTKEDVDTFKYEDWLYQKP